MAEASQRIDVRKLSVALLSGTGQMGVHLAAAWAHAGMDVTICSRDPTKVDAIVQQLLSGEGYSKGDVMLPAHPNYLPPPSKIWRLRAGDVSACATADVVILSSPFHVMWGTLEPLAPTLRGQGKIMIDISNPRIDTSVPKKNTLDQVYLRFKRANHKPACSITKLNSIILPHHGAMHIATYSGC